MNQAQNVTYNIILLIVEIFKRWPCRIESGNMILRREGRGKLFIGTRAQLDGRKKLSHLLHQGDYRW